MMQRLPKRGEQAEVFEQMLVQRAARFPYPATPDIAHQVRQRIEAQPARPPSFRRLAWALALLLALVAGLLLVPPTRAAILNFLQLGAVRIFLTEATPGQPPASSPQPTPTLILDLRELSGQTSLEAARERVNFAIRLPAYPAGLGLPDYVFLQDMDGEMLALVWSSDGKPARVELSLQFITAGSWAIDKFEPSVVQTTLVNNQPAIWAEGPYVMRLKNGDIQVRRLVGTHVLIWTEGDVTYRLESDLPLEEAVRIAESLK
jgi:hypothetical protein